MNKTQITLSQLLTPMSTGSLLQWAYTIDPNSSWAEWLADDSSVTVDTLRNAMLEAYDDEDTHHWINQ
jgi:hypothetical protein